MITKFKYQRNIFRSAYSKDIFYERTFFPDGTIEWVKLIKVTKTTTKLYPRYKFDPSLGYWVDSSISLHTYVIKVDTPLLEIEFKNISPNLIMYG